MEHHSDIIIIGAGASGLVAAKEASAKGKKITVLEAKPVAGGRIHTLEGAFKQPVESGAEFIHGNLPVTLQLLKEGNINYTKISGDMLRNTDGKWHETEEGIEGWDELMKRLSELKEDITFTQFLCTYFNDDKHADLRQSALQYAQGFDAADPDQASTFSLRNEWQNEEEDNYRINGGYGRLIDYLLTCCKQNNCNLLFNTLVKKIAWQRDEVVVTIASGENFYAKKALVTLPVGILANEASEAHIQFEPALPQVQEAAAKIGYGNVIKILLQFSSAFWQKGALFFFSNQKVATWWTQQPSAYPLLTGWIAGKTADKFKGMTEEEILADAVQSVAAIFGKKKEEIQQLLTASRVVNWEQDAFAGGAYSYGTIGSDEAKKTLNHPIENTLFFSGEALYSGPSGGTVEAALVNGLSVAKKILSS